MVKLFPTGRMAKSSLVRMELVSYPLSCGVTSNVNVFYVRLRLQITDSPLVPSGNELEWIALTYFTSEIESPASAMIHRVCGPLPL
jgi:hypothetical protein